MNLKIYKTSDNNSIIGLELEQQGADNKVFIKHGIEFIKLPPNEKHQSQVMFLPVFQLFENETFDIEKNNIIYSGLASDTMKDNYIDFMKRLEDFTNEGVKNKILH